jgi:DNA-binding MarR family transcriptional regulator
MNVIPANEMPDRILEDSVLAHVAAAYFAVSKQLERKTQCSSTRGFVLSTLRDGAMLNQNQIAKLLNIDRTVVHRTIRSLIDEGLLSEHKANSGRAIELRLSSRGKTYREKLIKARESADECIRSCMTSEDRKMLLKLLKQIAQCELD